MGDIIEPWEIPSIFNVATKIFDKLFNIAVVEI